tara:strand:- start:11722 stop:12024 length:303 start_codon:yes stop_codon:yes gene_type:complete
MLSNFHNQMSSLREAHNVNEYMRGDNRNNGVTQQTLRTLIGALLNNLHEGNVDEAIYQAEEIEHNIENLHINTSSCDSISEHLQDAWQVMYGDHYGTIDN